MFYSLWLNIKLQSSLNILVQTAQFPTPLYNSHNPGAPIQDHIIISFHQADQPLTYKLLQIPSLFYRLDIFKGEWMCGFSFAIVTNPSYWQYNNLFDSGAVKRKQDGSLKQISRKWIVFWFMLGLFLKHRFFKSIHYNFIFYQRIKCNSNI